MRVLVDGRVLTHQINTGVQRYTREILHAFDDIGFKYDVAVPEGVQNRATAHMWEHFALPGKAIKYDLLFCPANVSPVWKHKRLKMVTTLHSIAYKNYAQAYSRSFSAYYRCLIPLTIRLSDAIVTVSESEKKAIEEAYTRSKGKVIAVQNGIGRAFDQVRTPAKKEPYILYVGSLNPLKNVRGAIDAFRRISPQIPHKLYIVGPNPKVFKSYDRQAHERIIFLGSIEDDTRLAELYRSADLFLFPSFYEASPLPPTEAMACGCPVLVSDISALRERCGNAAVYCDPNNAENIADKLLAIVKDSELRDDLIQKGSLQIRKFKWESSAAEMVRLFERLCNGG